MMKINERQAEHLAVFLATVRRDWDPPGIKAALAKAKDRGDVWTIARAALRAASDPTNRTPAVIPLDGRHWRYHDDDEGNRPPLQRPFCALCHHPHWDYEPHRKADGIPPTDTYQAARAALQGTPPPKAPPP